MNQIPAILKTKELSDPIFQMRRKMSFCVGDENRCLIASKVEWTSYSVNFMTSTASDPTGTSVPHPPAAPSVTKYAED